MKNVSAEQQVASRQTMNGRASTRDYGAVNVTVHQGNEMESLTSLRTISVRVSRCDRLRLKQGLHLSSSPLWWPPGRSKITVERSEVWDKTFYFPFSSSAYEKARYVHTHASADEVVSAEDTFTIKFVGLSSVPKDTFATSRNELFVYSLQKKGGDAVPVCMPREQAVPTEANGEEKVEKTVGEFVSTGLPSVNDRVRIHMDPAIDSDNRGTVPNTFVSIPASKAVYYSQKGQTKAPVRFTALEIDRISDLHVRAVLGVDELGGYVSKAASVVPYSDLIVKAFNVADHLGKMGIRRFARPDLVVKRDVAFELRCGDGDNRDEDFLRYGYYAFLNVPVGCKLYAQTGSSGQMVGLFMRRVRYGKEEEFVPLTGVSYIILKVERGRDAADNDSDVDRDSDRIRLENVVQANRIMDMLLKGRKVANP